MKLRKAKAANSRLDIRRSAANPDKKGYKMPGSMNPHKQISGAKK